MRSGRRLIVHLDVLEGNFKKLKKICPHNEILFMVKANAYGHGLLPIADFSLCQLGIKEFGCATFEEAIALREAMPNKNFEIYVFSDFQLDLKAQSDTLIDKKLIPVLSNRKDLEFFLEEPKFKDVPICLKFNTGMNRLGINYGETEKVITRLIKAERKSIYHLMTHLACASLSMKFHRGNCDQLERFKEIKHLFQDKGIEIERSSCANSGAIEQRAGLEETHIRPGLMMYGPSSLSPEVADEGCWTGKIISKLEAFVIKTQFVGKGTSIGYGATTLPREGELAIVALGYGDGFATTFCGAHLDHHGVEGEVVGRVNMDMFQILFPKGTPLKKGEIFTVWDLDPKRLERLSRESGQLPYELFCQLTTRVPRDYQLE